MEPASAPRFSTQASLRGPDAIRVLDEAVAFLRRTPLSCYMVYYAGALPFAASFIYFIFDMLQSATAEKHLEVETLLVTLTYFWMKTCQAVFSRQLLALLEGHDPERWTPRRWLNTALVQTIFSATFFFIWPVALVITLPFGWVHAFYHSVSIVGTGRATTLRGCVAEAAKLAGLWPRQNHLILATMLAGFLILFLNVMVFLSLVPRLLNMLFGISTVFDESFSAWNNSSFYLDVAVLSFLVFNPLSKAVYVLRCFYGRGRLNGADLRAELQRLRSVRQAVMAAWVLGIGVLSCSAARADGSPAASPAPVTSAAPAPTPGSQVSPDALDHSIQNTLGKDEFAWREPKPPPQHQNETAIERAVHEFFHLLHQGLKAIFKPIGEFFRWLFRSSDHHDENVSVGNAVGAFPWAMVFLVVLIVVVALLAWLIFRNFRANSLTTAAAVTLLEIKTIDLASDSVRADALPEDSWLALAQEMLDKGEMRLALRAFYLATLALLAQRELIRLGSAKSNRDYLQDLTRRLRDRTEAIPPFRESVRLFEGSWYGTHAATISSIDAIRTNHSTIRGYVAA